MASLADAGDRRLRGGEEDRPYSGTAWWMRAGRLYAVSRRVPQTLAAIAVLAVLVWWAMRLPPTEPLPGIDLPMLTGRNATMLLHLAAALLASVIGIAVHTPFGETERVSPVVLPVMRGAHLLGLLVVGCVALGMVIADWGEVVPGVDLVPVFARNVVFLTGLVLLAGRVADVRLVSLLPVVLGGVTVTGLVQDRETYAVPADMWRDRGWNVLALDLSHGWATAACLGVGIAAFAVYVRDGVRDSAEGE
jgi:hypothetical protein